MTTAPKLEPCLLEAVGKTLGWRPNRNIPNTWIDPSFPGLRSDADAAREIERLRAAPSAGLREALEKIQQECSPDFLPFANPENGRRAIYEIATAALTLSKERGEVALPHQTNARDE